MKSNVSSKVRKVPTVTHEGAPAVIPQAQEQLVRLTATCMLFENTFYEPGSVIAQNITQAIKSVSPEYAAKVARMARNDFKLRHVPMFIMSQLAYSIKERRGTPPKGVIEDGLADIIQRADEVSEFLVIHAKVNGVNANFSKGVGLGKLKMIMSSQIKKGLARAFTKFDAYRLAKYNRDDVPVTLKQALFLCHAKPKDKAQEDLWKKLVDGTLESPNTWEVRLSRGENKKAVFEDLLRNKQIGDLALLRNLRNMSQVNVDRRLISEAIAASKFRRVLPFRFVAAAKFAPEFAAELSDAMVRASEGTLAGHTVIVIDVSGSMDGPLSEKSQMNRIDAAGALAAILREQCPSVRVFTFSDREVEVKNFRGLAMVDGVNQSQYHSGTQLASSLAAIHKKVGTVDRLVVVTDEQAHFDSRYGSITPPFGTHSYVINVAGYAPALNLSGGWMRFNGFSERIIDFIRWHETGITPGEYERGYVNANADSSEDGDSEN